MNLYGRVEQIILNRDRSDTVTVQLGEFLKPNPDEVTDDDLSPEFLDAEPTDDGAEFAETLWNVDLPFELFDMPSAGDYVRIEVVSR